MQAKDVAVGKPAGQTKKTKTGDESETEDKETKIVVYEYLTGQFFFYV